MYKKNLLFFSDYLSVVWSHFYFLYDLSVRSPLFILISLMICFYFFFVLFFLSFSKFFFFQIVCFIFFLALVSCFVHLFWILWFCSLISLFSKPCSFSVVFFFILSSSPSPIILSPCRSATGMGGMCWFFCALLAASCCVIFIFPDPLLLLLPASPSVWLSSSSQGRRLTLSTAQKHSITFLSLSHSRVCPQVL